MISRVLENPEESYPPNESFNKYLKGYGDIHTQFWLGLSTMYNLNNEFENDILRIEATTHNGTEIWVEFDNFQIQNRYICFTVHTVNSFLLFIDN